MESASPSVKEDSRIETVSLNQMLSECYAGGSNSSEECSGEDKFPDVARFHLNEICMVKTNLDERRHQFVVSLSLKSNNFKDCARVGVYSDSVFWALAVWTGQWEDDMQRVEETDLGSHLKEGK